MVDFLFLDTSLAGFLGQDVIVLKGMTCHTSKSSSHNLE